MDSLESWLPDLDGTPFFGLDRKYDADMSEWLRNRPYTPTPLWARALRSVIEWLNDRLPEHARFLLE